jgi:hypothetical protein
MSFMIGGRRRAQCNQIPAYPHILGR